MRFLRFTLLAIIFSTAALWVAAACRPFILVRWHYVITLGDGGLIAVRWPDYMEPSYAEADGMFTADPKSWNFFIRSLRAQPMGQRIRFWPILAATIPTWIILHRLNRSRRIQRKRELDGACQSCGYDLTGNVSRICPECGAAMSAPLAPGKENDVQCF